MEHMIAMFAEQIVAASVDRTGLCISGGGTKDWYGQAPSGARLTTREHTGIVDYEPTELVITARCGTPLSEIEAALAAQRQMLAFEPPHFGSNATLGGAVAAGLSGPRRQAVGAMRDFVLGVTMMNGQGQVLHFGGQVMKNVAGYDVSRLLAGSLGTLGLLLEVSLKVLPKPITETTVRLSMPQAEAITQLNIWGGQPLPISASLWQDDSLTIRLSGAQAAVGAARLLMGGEEIEGEPFWQAAREQTLPLFAGINEADALWRLSVPSTTPPLDLPGKQLIEWGGAQRWLRTTAAAGTTDAIRATVSAAGGHATLFRGGDKMQGVFQPLAPAVARIHQRLKATFDPQSIFNPGRMYLDL
ncbi:MAG: glycolate oxidase subunit GlcE [Pseudomonadota bacterium]